MGFFPVTQINMLMSPMTVAARITQLMGLKSRAPKAASPGSGVKAGNRLEQKGALLALQCRNHGLGQDVHVT